MGDIRTFTPVDEQSLRDKIYVIRNQHVMLDSDIAEIYGYETRYLNLQVKHNMNRFPEDFMFQLTKEEYHDLMLNNSTSSHGGRRKPPYAFTEQGIYQLATVLKGELAERQSVAIMRVFKAMREFIVQNKQFLSQPEFLNLSGKQASIEKDIREIKDNMVTRAELSDLMQLFDSSIEHDEILIFNGEPFKADIAYQKIYSKAKKKLALVDDYISSKTLQHLAHSKSNVKILIISDNKGKQPLRKMEYLDFINEYPGREIIFLSTSDKVHDRYIFLDYGSKDMKVYHCGASSKDAGKKITTITQVKDLSNYDRFIQGLLNNPEKILK